MNLQELAAKVTGVDEKLSALRTDLEATQAENKNLSERLQTAEEKAATTSEHADTLTAANEKLTADLETANKQLSEATAKVEKLQAEAKTVREAASEEAVDIVATQGADAAAAAHSEDAASEGIKSTAELLAEMQRLPIGERHAFYQKHRDKLNPHK